MEQEQEAFALQYHECTKISGKQINKNIKKETLLIMVYFSAHLQQLTAQPNAQQNSPIEQKLRRQKDTMEIMLNQKVTYYDY